MSHVARSWKSLDFLKYWCYASGSVMEWNQIHIGLEKAYIQGDFNLVEQALEKRMDFGVIFPCILLYDAVRIGRYNTVRILMENYSDVITDETTLTAALRDVILHHDVRLLCEWGYIDEHVHDVTLRNADVMKERRHCPCERAKIVNSLILNGAKLDNIRKVITDFLLTTPIICQTSFYCCIDMLLDHGCDLSPILNRFATCNSLYQLSRQTFLTTISRSKITNKTTENLLPVIILHEDIDAIGEIQESFPFGMNEIERTVESRPDLKPKFEKLKTGLNEIKMKPSSLQSLSRKAIRDVLAKKRAELAENKPKTVTNLIRNLDYPVLLKRYLTYDCFQWRRRDID